MSYRLRNIGIAVALAVPGGPADDFLRHQLQEERPAGRGRASPSGSPRSDVAVGTSGAEVVATDAFCARAKSPRRNVVPGAISEPYADRDARRHRDDLRGRAGHAQPLQGRSGEQGIKAQLKGRLRAFRLAAAAEHQLLMRHPRRAATTSTSSARSRSGTEPVHACTKVVLRDLLVLKAPDSGAGRKASSAPSRTRASRRSLEVTDAPGAEALPCSLTNGDWTLELRPVTDADRQPGEHSRRLGHIALDGRLGA